MFMKEFEKVAESLNLSMKIIYSFLCISQETSYIILRNIPFIEATKYKLLKNK